MTIIGDEDNRDGDDRNGDDHHDGDDCDGDNRDGDNRDGDKTTNPTSSERCGAQGDGARLFMSGGIPHATLLKFNFFVSSLRLSHFYFISRTI